MAQIARFDGSFERSLERILRRPSGDEEVVGREAGCGNSRPHLLVAN